MKKHDGFTLVELLITLVVVGIAVSLAVPGFARFIREQQITTQTNDFLTALNIARSEALKRGGAVSVCASSDGATCSGNNDWDAGWIVFSDEAGPTPGTLEGGSGESLLRVHPGLEGGNTLTADGGADFVRFLGDGLAGTRDDFTLTPATCEGNQIRSIDLAITGRADTSEVACP
ncbi:MAG: GspH/FimT family pseudopilin [Halofilum sp. (in: g-proteobacteria)]|nr:GspH/FimT family pseudopilin [Halofilum sp. (in: g-proteobacteria)]